MIRKRVVACGLVVLLLGVFISVLTVPIFPLAEQQPNAQPSIQKTDTIVDYSFILKMFSATKEIPINISPDQTLNIQASTNSVAQDLFGTTQLTFDFFIVTPQADRIDAIYYQQQGVTSVNANWNPPTSGQYTIRFSSPKASGGYNVNTDINAHITKTYSVSNPAVSVTVLRQILPSAYLSLGFVLTFAGIALLIASISILRLKEDEAS